MSTRIAKAWRFVTVALVAFWLLSMFVIQVVASGSSRFMCNLPQTTSAIAVLSKWSSLFATFLTPIGILTAGLWAYLVFVRTRQKYPRLNLKLEELVRRIDENRILVRIGVHLENVGAVLADLNHIRVWIQQLEPWQESDVGSILKIPAKVSKNDDMEVEGAWEILCERTVEYGKRQKEVEPGETDVIWFDFVIESDVDLVLVYVYVRNLAKRKRILHKRSEIGWSASKSVDTSHLEAKMTESGNKQGSGKTERTIKQGDPKKTPDTRQGNPKREPPKKK